MAHMTASELFLHADERGNPHTRIDAHRGDGTAWSTGNECVPLVHGVTYFRALYAAVSATGAGDLVYFVDWRGDPDQRLTDDPDSTVSEVLCAAALRGAEVRGLLWRSHPRFLGYHADRSLALAQAIRDAGGQCLRDMRVRTAGAHHQKFVVVRYADDPSRDVAFVGGIDLCHSRRDDRDHHGDPQALPMASAYGSRPAWHDVHASVRGPAVYDVETTFRERWQDSTPLTMNLARGLASRLQDEDLTPRPLMPQAPPPPVIEGAHDAVQVLRTYPAILPKGYDFAPDGERSVVLGSSKAVGLARRLIYVEDQYLWSETIGEMFAVALRENPGLRIVVILPLVPDEDSAFAMPPQMYGRRVAMERMLEAGGDRVAFFGLTAATGLPIYVHSKVCIVDDDWVSVGSDNFNRRSWSSDSELSLSIADDRDDGERPSSFALRLRRELVGEHLGCDPDDVPVDLDAVFAAMGASADALDAWYAGARGRELVDRVRARTTRPHTAWARRQRERSAMRLTTRAAASGQRPPGQLRRLSLPTLTTAQQLWAPQVYSALFDPDGTVLRDEDLVELSTPAVGEGAGG